jgi:general secretion pathway protein L
MTLLIALPETTACTTQTAYRYAVSQDGTSLLQHGQAVLDLLPRGMGETVLILPPTALSWHAVKLPQLARSTSQARLRSILEGLLEEHLLDEVGAVHLALEPGRHTGQPAGHRVWVACCDKNWLLEQLHLFEQQGRPVSRLMAAYWPAQEGQATEVVLAGQTDHPRLHVCSAGGVWTLPVSDASSFQQALNLSTVTAASHAPPTEPAQQTEPQDEAQPTEWPAAAAQPEWLLRCEPALAVLAQRWCKQDCSLQTQEERWLQAYAGDYDLAQFDIRLGGHSHALRRWKKYGLQFLQVPQWRPARLGLLLLLMVQLIGLNSWAWKLQRHVESLRAQTVQLLQTSFPEIKVVVDAPRQMARQIHQLRQSAGELATHDLESLLHALAHALPAGVQLQQMSYQPGQLQFRLQAASALPAETLQQTAEQLAPLGLRLHASTPDGPYILATLQQP